MRFGSIEVPSELVDAARAGELVFFVGAGASMDPPSSLPSFGTLVADIGTLTGTPATDADFERPDRFLGGLVDQGVDVHGLVADAVDLPGSAPNRLHRAIVDLARAHGPVRVVTTNYDHHLTTATREAGLDPDIFLGPALPVGHDFEGLVHLHGALGQETRRLIVTDTDFGHAYLREAWAARFLEQMFSKFAVAFIGYRHGDIVMQYLARSLGRDGRRFVFTDDGDLPDWESLGVTPIPYELRGEAGDSHEALPDSLERWAELQSRGSIQHRLRIAEIVGTEQPTTVPEEVDYLKDCLRDPERVRYFVEAARGRHWLGWVAGQPEFATLFSGADTSGVPHEVTATLRSWVTEHYIAAECWSAAALRVMRGKTWSDPTWISITHCLLTSNGRVPDWQLPWLVLALDQAPPGRTDLLDMILNQAGWSERLDVAALLFEHRTRPVVTSGIDFGEENDPPYFQVDIVGDETSLTEAWAKVFVPELATYAAELLDLIVNQLRAAYRMAWALYPGSEAISFGRSAIEPHDQDDFREPFDVLIDAARDCLESLLKTDAPEAVRRLDQWTTADQGLFRRLAVHGYRLRNDLAPDEKVGWLCGQRLLYDLVAQHEVFLLLQENVPAAGEEQVRALLELVRAGPPDERPDDDDHHHHDDDHDGHGGDEGDEGDDGDDGGRSQYRRYNLLVWLAQAAPDSTPIADALREVQEANPTYQPRPHPDLNMYMEATAEADVEPFSAEELHAKIADDPQAALTEIRSHHIDDDRFGHRGPTWQGALNAVRTCVTKYPDDGTHLATHLDEGDRDLRVTMINAWSDADLNDDKVHAVLDVARGWKPDQIRNAAARMLANGGDGNRPTAWHQYDDARELATSLWPHEQVTGNIDESTDLHAAAINHPAGDLAQFWTKAIAFDWSTDRENWAGIPAPLRQHLDTMLVAEGRNGVFARTILGGQLHFYFSAEPTWAEQNLLPLFNWETRPDDATAVWQGFLAWGRPDQGLLDAGLLGYYLQTCTRTDQLGRERATEQLAAHLAYIATSSTTDPGTWLPRFIKEAPEKLRVAWARRVGVSLRRMTPEQSDAQWERWVRSYWTGRASSVPLPFTGAEASGTADWVFGLPTRRSEAVAIVERTTAGLDVHDQLLYRLNDTSLESDPTTWMRFLLHLLRGTTTPSWSICHYLAKIVGTLKAADPALDISDLINRAMELGCADAPNW